ncbi:MAG: RidA family protein [bacterium]
MGVEEKLAALGLEIPATFKPSGSYVPAQIAGNIIYASGQTGKKDGKLQHRGKLGAEISLEEGYEAARLAMVNCLGGLKAVLGDLDRIERIVRVTGYVASAPGFNEQPKVINGASDLLLEVFGTKGEHARTAIGVAELPGGAPVEVEVICMLKE